MKDQIVRRLHWVFDLDGTLTVAVHDFLAIKRELGLAEGQDILTSLSELPDAIAEAKHEQLVRIEERLAEATTAADGAVELITELVSRGASIGIITRNTRTNALTTLRKMGIDRYLAEDQILGRENAAPKPDPEGLYKLSAQWGADPQTLVMVGDYKFDLMAGRRARAATLYIDASGEFPWRAHADWCVRSLSEVVLELPD